MTTTDWHTLLPELYSGALYLAATALIGIVGWATLWVKAYFATKVSAQNQALFNEAAQRSIAFAAAMARDLGTDMDLDHAVIYFKQHWPDLINKKTDQQIADAMNARVPSPEAKTADQVAATTSGATSVVASPSVEVHTAPSVSPQTTKDGTQQKRSDK